MSTSTMWLLLFVVVALALLVAALTKTKFTVQKISIIGVMAALSLVAYEFFRIPNVFGSGSSFHLGNTFTALTAMLLDGVSGGLAGAIGLALADILAGDPGYAITTFILKFIIGLVCGFVAHKVIHLKTYPTANRGKYLLVVTASAFSGLLVNVFTDPFIGYFRNRFIFGQPAEIASVFTKNRQRRYAYQLAAVHRLRGYPVPGPAPGAGKSPPAAQGLSKHYTASFRGPRFGGAFCCLQTKKPVCHSSAHGFCVL